MTESQFRRMLADDRTQALTWLTQRWFELWRIDALRDRFVTLHTMRDEDFMPFYEWDEDELVEIAHDGRYFAEEASA